MIVSLIFIVALIIVASGDVETDRFHRLCSAYGYQLIKAKFGTEEHLLCLKYEEIGSSALTSRSAALVLDPDWVDSANAIRAFPLHGVTMAYGFPVEAPSEGSAEGYIGDDHHFYGVLHIGGRTLHADPYGKDDPKRLFGGFDNDVMVAPSRPRRDHAHAQLDMQYGPHFPFHIEDRKPVPGIARARVCDLLLLADKEFYQKDANSSLNHVVRRMVHAVAQADIIFRNADFNEDGVPDNIGFAVKYILVLTSHETNSRVFGDLLKSKTIDGRQYLMRFARLRRLSEVCLGVAFSGHAFHNRTLGLSFTSLGGGVGGAAGGLCDRRAYGRSFNTLALAHATTEYDTRVPERIAALTLAHEMGHSFGAHHDDNFPNPLCRGYLMGSQSSDAETSKHLEFSLCSKRLIAATLHSMSYCLTEEDRPYCGNGIVEEGEACDCGMPSRCSQQDPCCTPRAGGATQYEEGTLHKEGCSVSPAAVCHPSQGLCCNAHCTYANLTEYGIDCETLDQECTCEEKSSECRCALGGRCLPDGTCHAAECALLGLRECPCYHKGAGGSVSLARRCGVCCMMGGRACVGAEFAARALVANGTMLPRDWPGDDYIGPNVTVEVCTEDGCHTAALRAWPAGAPCVSRGAVGVCSITGVCKPRYLAPRSNVYPTIMNARLASRTRKSSSTPRPVAAELLLNINALLIAFTFIVASENIYVYYY